MLSQKNRLTKKEDIDFLKKNGRKYQGKFFAVLSSQKEKDLSRFGFIVSTKVAKNATERNRLKRTLREVTRRLFPDLSVGYDVLFLVRKEMLNQSFPVVLNEVKDAFQKIGLLK